MASAIKYFGPLVCCDGEPTVACCEDRDIPLSSLHATFGDGGIDCGLNGMSFANGETKQVVCGTHTYDITCDILNRYLEGELQGLEIRLSGFPEGPDSWYVFCGGSTTCDPFWAIDGGFPDYCDGCGGIEVIVTE